MTWPSDTPVHPCPRVGEGRAARLREVLQVRRGKAQPVALLERQAPKVSEEPEAAASR